MLGINLTCWLLGNQMYFLENLDWQTVLCKQMYMIQLVTSHLQCLNCMHLASPWTITLGNRHPCWWAKVEPPVAAAVTSSPSAGDIGPQAMFWPCAVIWFDMCYRITSIFLFHRCVCIPPSGFVVWISICGYLGINRVEQEQLYNCYGNPLWPFSCSSLPAPFFTASAAGLFRRPFHHCLIGSKVFKMQVLK